MAARNALAKVIVRNSPGTASEVLICTGSGCALSGSLEVVRAFESALAKTDLDGQVTVRATGCHGLCAQGPVVVVDGAGIFSPQVQPDMVDRIVDEHLRGGKVVRDYLYVEPTTGSKRRVYSRITFNKKQKRLVLRNCGKIDPEEIDDYIEAGGYLALGKALDKMTPSRLIQLVESSGLRGRGGAGFPAGKKWSLTRAAAGEKKYIICNADEGDPGAFMDRSILESDPHSLLEGMAIAAYAVGADEGYIYVRAEYPLAVKRVRRALEQAEERGFIGADALGDGCPFHVHVIEGAGAFVCGEETALIASIEGRRGMPRMRPPFPAVSGLWGAPTTINNVETLATVPWIVTHGAGRYARIGTDTSKGTKVFALTGKVERSGLAEVPMGTTLREIVVGIGGGVPDGGRVKAVQIGGPSGGCLPEKLLDTPVDYESLSAVGAIVGSGGLVVLDEQTCMVDIARFFLAFTQDESCGKCVPCRLGTKRMLETVTRITQGEGQEGDAELLERLAHHVKATSLCGLGQTAPTPVLTTLRYFREEYDEHIREKHCRAGACVALRSYYIDAEACRGCLVCKRHCPVGAISGRAKEAHVIDEARCVKCGVCTDHCAFEAIHVQ